MSNMKRTPVGKSSKIKDGKTSAPAGKQKELHTGGKTVPSFNAARIDKLEATNPVGTGGLKK